MILGKQCYQLVLAKVFELTVNANSLDPQPWTLNQICFQLKGLILAQNERWQRGLGMQVERQVFLRKDGGAANGVVKHRNVPFRPG